MGSLRAKLCVNSSRVILRCFLLCARCKSVFSMITANASRKTVSTWSGIQPPSSIELLRRSPVPSGEPRLSRGAERDGAAFSTAGGGDEDEEEEDDDDDDEDPQEDQGEEGEGNEEEE